MEDRDILAYVRDHGGAAVLATLLRTEGHAYRKPGAAMLLLPEGRRIGSLSPGCLEADLQERAMGLLRDNRWEIVDYNVRPEEDAIWGEAIGCGGTMRILLEPVGDRLRTLLSAACAEVDAGREATLVRYVAEEADGGIAYALEPDDSAQAAGKRRLFAATYAPKPRVVVFGADEGAMPICELAAWSGFRVAVGDWRAPLCEPSRFPAAEAVAVGTPAELAARLRIGADDAIVICSHHLRRDREMLELAMAIGPAYIGVMGSASRISRLFEGLRATAAVHAPIGLRIGADGPRQIALSVVAELVAERNRRRKGEAQGGSGDALRRYTAGGGEQPADGFAQAFPASCPR